jgi:hypothetical protein
LGGTTTSLFNQNNSLFGNYSILVKIRKKKMKAKRMIKMMENREVRALPLFKMIMKIKINWI